MVFESQKEHDSFVSLAITFCYWRAVAMYAAAYDFNAESTDNWDVFGNWSYCYKFLNFKKFKGNSHRWNGEEPNWDKKF